MVHSITKKTDFGFSKIEVSKVSDKKEVYISIFYFNFENELIDVQYITLNEKEYFSLIGTMLYVQSQLKK